MRAARLIVGVSTGSVLLVGCEGPSPESGPDAASWEPPDSYSFVVESSCGERDFLGRYRISVEENVVTGVVGLDGYARRLIADDEHRARVPTLSELVAEADAARFQDADRVDVDVDPLDGHPTSIEIDWAFDATDDEACYDVSDYSAADAGP